MVIIPWPVLQWIEDFLRPSLDTLGCSGGQETEYYDSVCVRVSRVHRLCYTWDSGVHVSWMSHASEVQMRTTGNEDIFKPIHEGFEPKCNMQHEEMSLE